MAIVIYYILGLLTLYLLARMMIDYCKSSFKLNRFLLEIYKNLFPRAPKMMIFSYIGLIGAMVILHQILPELTGDDKQVAEFLIVGIPIALLCILGNAISLAITNEKEMVKNGKKEITEVDILKTEEINKILE